MSDKKQSVDRLPLPSPRPPAGLDRKILAYARANTPVPARRMPARWTAGLATVAVVAVAVIIALPPQPGQEISHKAEQRSTAPAAPAPTERIFEKRSQGLQMEAARETSALAVDAEAPAKSRLADAPESAYAASAAAPADATDAASLAAQLAPIAELLQSGDEDRAREAYRALRNACQRCELPDTLEQALAEYPTEPSP